MKIPKTYHGIQVIIPNKTPKHKKDSIATADITKDGKPIIKIWKGHKNEVTPRVLTHEEGHIKLGHYKKEGPITRGEYFKQEKQAERYSYKTMGGKGQIPSSRLGHIVSEIISEGSKSKQEYIFSHWDNFRKYTLDRSSAYGFTKDEMKRGIDYFYEHSKRKLQR